MTRFQRAARSKAGTHGKPDDFGVAPRKDDQKVRALLDEGYKAQGRSLYWQELQKKYLNK